MKYVARNDCVCFVSRLADIQNSIMDYFDQYDINKVKYIDLLPIFFPVIQALNMLF